MQGMPSLLDMAQVLMSARITDIQFQFHSSVFSGSVPHTYREMQDTYYFSDCEETIELEEQEPHLKRECLVLSSCG